MKKSQFSKILTVLCMIFGISASELSLYIDPDLLQLCVQQSYVICSPGINRFSLDWRNVWEREVLWWSELQIRPHSLPEEQEAETQQFILMLINIQDINHKPAVIFSMHRWMDQQQEFCKNKESMLSAMVKTLKCY